MAALVFIEYLRDCRDPDTRDHLDNDEILHDLISAGMERLRENHPDLDIQIVEKPYPYPNEKTALIDSLANGTSIDLFSADQIWLGELADRGLDGPHQLHKQLGESVRLVPD